MSSLDFFKNQVDRAISDLNFDLQPKELYEPIHYILSLGGKRLRPLLVLYGNALFQGKVETALKPAAAIELFHNFTLVHDDIMDKAPVRRGKTTVHEKWDQNIAILSGDAMMIKTYELLVDSNPQNLAQLLKTFNRVAIAVCEGQQEDMNFEQREDVSIDEYLRMIEKKTAVLLGGSLEIGAITANATEKQCEQVYQFGKNMGMAFQLMDDLLDVYGDADKFGKKVGGDILADKKTYMLLKAKALASPSQNLVLGDSDLQGEIKVEKTTKVFDDLGIRETTMELAQNYFTQAKIILEEIEGEAKIKADLMNFSKSLMSRIS